MQDKTNNDVYQFLDFVLSSNVLSFGKFKTKAGRDSPYFFNTGLTAASGNTYYGPRTFGTNNIISTTNKRPIKTSSNLNRKDINNNEKLTSSINSEKIVSQEKYTIPKNEQKRWQYSNSANIKTERG